MLKLLLSVAAVAGLLTAGVRAQDFNDRCAQLAAQAQISVTFQDRQVDSDDSRNIQALNGISGKPAGSNHNVYGLTYANPQFRMQVKPRAISDAGGSICAIPDLSIELGFSEFIVYLAKELTDPCQRDIIRQHEQEHVNTWKSHLRASAQLLTTVLRNNLGEPRRYASREEAEAGIRAWAGELVAPWAKRIITSVSEAQGSIDTPVSYGIVASRLRTCGQAVRGGSR
jgi:hypothetical protein